MDQQVKELFPPGQLLHILIERHGSKIYVGALLTTGYVLLRRMESRLLRTTIGAIGCCSLIYTLDLPPGKMSTMLTCALYWMSSIKLLHLLATAPKEKPMTAKDYLFEFLWFILPISRNPDPPRPLTKLLLDNGLIILTGIFKIIGQVFFTKWLLKCLDKHPGTELMNNPLLTLYYIPLLAAMIFCSNSGNDFQIAAVSLTTNDRYQLQEFNRYPLLSRNLRDFWGRRYNRLVGKLLRESVFSPLRPFIGPSGASLATFFVSGALHAHVAHVSFGRGILASFAFFAVQGAACSIADVMWGRNTPRPIAIALTNGFLWLTAPLYLGLMLQASPGWILDNMGNSWRLPFEIPTPPAYP